MRGPDWPIATPGQAVGLLGGSFDPAHQGHLAITTESMKRFALDRVWWLVSPGNPLKRDTPASLERRVAHAADVAHHPRIDVTALEVQIKARFTADTIAALKARYPGVRFVWLMGSDNLAQFHKWDRWKSIAGAVPIGVLARPGHRLSALNGTAARMLRHSRVPAGLLAQCDPPAWSFANIPMRSDSSTALRRAGVWKR